MIRNAKLASPFRSLPNANTRPVLAQHRTAVARQALDAFDNGPTNTGSPNIGLNLGNGPSGVVTTPANPTNSIVPSNNTNVTAPGSSSTSTKHKGFFASLWDGIKSFASGLLGKATSYLDGNWGSWMSSASSAIGGLFSGLADKAKTWLDGLLGGVTNKLDS